LGQYHADVNATSNATLATEDTWIELFPPAGVAIRIKRIRVSVSTAASDTITRVRVQRASAAGATGTAFTPTKRQPSTTGASATTCNVKNGTTAFSVGTAVANSVQLDVNFNDRGVFEWVARDDDDYIWSGVNERIAILLRDSVASIIHGVEVDWVE
jgi:hypothetical protein